MLITREKLSRRLWRYKKTLHCSISPPHSCTKPVFIMGCGRSGTTMLINIFHRHPQAEARDEFDKKIAKDFMLIFDRVPAALQDSRYPILVMKPILNSFDTRYLMDIHPKSKVIWCIRNYKDMIASSIRKFNSEVANYMKDYIISQSGDNWLSKKLPPQTRTHISKLDSSAFSAHDWMGLIWWSVNRTVILDRLLEDKRFLLVSYESLVNRPEKILRTIFEFIGVEFQKNLSKYVHHSAVGKGKNIVLHPQVDMLCNNLLDSIIYNI